MAGFEGGWIAEVNVRDYKLKRRREVKRCAYAIAQQMLTNRTMWMQLSIVAVSRSTIIQEQCANDISTDWMIAFTGT